MAREQVEKPRINIELSQAAKENLEYLKEMTDAASVAEVVRRALVLYHVAGEIHKEGGRVLFERGDGSTEPARLLEFVRLTPKS